MRSIPKHVAIIMDGNGRWAQRRGLPRIAGHRAGAKSVRKIIKACDEFGIEVLTLFAFGQENWRRPAEEIEGLMGLFLQVLQRDVKKLHKNNVRVRIIGDHTPLSTKIKEKIAEAEQLTAGNTKLHLNIAINYSGRWDIVNAVKGLVAEQLAPAQIDEAVFAAKLSMAELPEPDLFIRTSGEERLSNFLLWQLAYTELYFTDTMWPDFDKKSFATALEEYSRRERRFGGVKI